MNAPQTGRTLSARTPPSRLPRHVGFIPDGNRRWAEERGEPRREGYRHGIRPGLLLLDLCRDIGIEEVSVYGFTKENAHRPPEQVAAFRDACSEFGREAVAAGAALLAIGDTRSDLFPEALKPYARQRSAGKPLLNLLVNYDWRWDLGGRGALNGRRAGKPRSFGSTGASRVDLVVRWGGRRRLSGFLPLQSAYADIYVVDTLWPDMEPEEFLTALSWYAAQDVTLGG